MASVGKQSPFFISSTYKREEEGVAKLKPFDDERTEYKVEEPYQRPETPVEVYGSLSSRNV